MVGIESEQNSGYDNVYEHLGRRINMYLVLNKHHTILSHDGDSEYMSPFSDPQWSQLLWLANIALSR
jgi:hypothetical protein